MAPLPPRDQRHPWLRLVNRVYVLDFDGLTEGMRHTLAGRLRMVYTQGEEQELFTSYAWRRLFEIRTPLVREFILEFLSTFRMSDIEMGLMLLTLYVFSWVEPSRACTEKGMSGARLSGGYFIGRLATHFRLVSDQGLRGLSMVTHELSMIDLHELVRLNIYERIGDTVCGGAGGAAEDAHAVNEGAQADPALVQAPQPPPAAPRTMPKKIARVKEEVHELRRSIDAIRRIIGFGIRRIDYLYRPCCKEIDDMVYSEKDVC
ncbi:hypothetical protein Tco_0916036 [Tanacetum coccineum]